MQTIDELSQNLKLTPEQTAGVKSFISALVIELLQSIKEDNIKNFDETIKDLESGSAIN